MRVRYSIELAQTSVCVHPFCATQGTPSDEPTSSAAVSNSGDASEEESDLLFLALEKAARQFKMAPPLRELRLGQPALTGLFFPVGSDSRQTNLERLVLQMATASTPGSHWYLAQLLSRLRNPQVSKAAIDLCDFPPKETLTILSSCPSLTGEDPRRGYNRGHDVGDTATAGKLRSVCLKKPRFNDVDMLVALRSLPGYVMVDFSVAVYEALALWDFGGSAEYIVQTVLRDHKSELPVLQVFGALSGVQADTGDGIRAIQGLVSPDMMDFADMKFTPGFSEVVIGVARVLGVNGLAEVGTPLNNADFVAWIRANTGKAKIEELTGYQSSHSRLTLDGLALRLLENLVAKRPDALDVAVDRLVGRRKDGAVSSAAKVMAVLLGSAAFQPDERGFFLGKMFEKEILLTKFGEVATGIRPVHRTVAVAGDAPLTYMRAPARAANLAVWLASYGIALRFECLEDLQKEVPKLVKQRLTETNDIRKRGLGIWLSWLTESGKKAESGCD